MLSWFRTLISGKPHEDRFVPWHEFLDPNDSGRTGPGCGGEL